ncbi:MAG: glycosyltransferase family 2 protein [Rikenellaceae bacterium]
MNNNTLSPRVSVITACYNSQHTIRDAIESVQQQSYSNWEMIIVDDCSSDNTCEIINEYIVFDSRVKLIKCDQPSGSPTKPRNIAIENATGRYIAFIDSDDMWHKHKLERQIKLAQESKSPFVFSNYEKMNAKGEVNNRIVEAPAIVTIKDMYYGNPIGCLTALIDRDVFPNFKFKKIGHEDCVAWIEILQRGYKAYNTNSVEAVYRESNNSVSSNKLTILHWQWNIYRHILNFNIFKSLYYYTHYAINGLIKSLK